GCSASLRGRGAGGGSGSSSRWRSVRCSRSRCRSCASSSRWSGRRPRPPRSSSPSGCRARSSSRSCTACGPGGWLLRPAEVRCPSDLLTDDAPCARLGVVGPAGKISRRHDSFSKSSPTWMHAQVQAAAGQRTRDGATVSTVSTVNSFGAKGTLEVGDASHEIYRLSAVPGLERLPYSLKVLAENLLRTEDGENITADHVRALAEWDPAAEPSTEIQFTPARVVMQD